VFPFTILLTASTLSYLFYYQALRTEEGSPYLDTDIFMHRSSDFIDNKDFKTSSNISYISTKNYKKSSDIVAEHEETRHLTSINIGRDDNSYNF